MRYFLIALALTVENGEGDYERRMDLAPTIEDKEGNVLTSASSSND